MGEGAGRGDRRRARRSRSSIPSQPDLLFLDVRLPELSGLEVARRIRHSPEIVFTTAYDRFALAAFELGALDYLLKPFGRDRFHAALERVRSRLRPTSSPAVERARIALEEGRRGRLFARSGDRIVPIADGGDPPHPGSRGLRRGARARAGSFSCA